MRNISLIKIAVVLTVFALSFTATRVFAAEVHVDSKSQKIKAGEQFEAGIFLKTQEEYINAVEGKILFPNDLLELKEIRDGNSIVNFWIEKPHISPLGAIVFSGITPGGFSGQKGLLLSVLFRAKASGEGTIRIDEVQVLKNDGEGTPASLKIFPFQFSASEGYPAIQPIVKPMRDTGPPEAFRPEIAQNSDMFNGQWFLVFATQDKGSGIDRYEVCEGSKRKCVIAESPYVLQNQMLDQKVFVKVIDKSGNEQIEVFYPPYWHPPWYENYWILGILIIAAIILAYLILEVLWRKRKK